LPHEKNSEEHSLKIYSKGLTTTPLPVEVNGDLEALEININLVDHRIEIILDKETEYIETDLSNIKNFTKKLHSTFDELKVPILLEERVITEDVKINYNDKKAELLWEVLKTIYFAIFKFNSTTLEETSNINFWPHHFDIAMLMFTGNLIPGQDESNWNYSREQMNFGFLFGDDFIPNPYFYVTLYPFDKDFLNKELSNGAYWYQKNWYGAILEINSETNEQTIVQFFNEIRNLKEN